MEENAHDLPYGKGAAGETGVDGIQRLMRVMEEYEAVFVSGVNATVRNGIVKYCVDKGKACAFVPHTGDVITSGAEHIRSFAVPICRARRFRPTPEYLFVKRAMDIALSLAAIIISSPFMAVTALAIFGYDRGPVLYQQVRLTRDGKPFRILNLRCMQVVHRLHNIMAHHSIISFSKSTIFSRFSGFRHSSGRVSCVLTA